MTRCVVGVQAECTSLFSARGSAGDGGREDHRPLARKFKSRFEKIKINNSK